MEISPLDRDTAVNNCRGLLREGIPVHWLHSNRPLGSLYVRFGTTADGIGGPGRAGESVGQGNIQNHGFDCHQSPVGYGRSLDSIPQASIDSTSMDHSANECLRARCLCDAGYRG